ncbi:MAG: polysaccharide biosynthesis C-terminal domain-containing protein [Acidobacteriota bacterium]|nr:polysaccharide biosynthesis C-terminal domain-containing protein [Acidobacteriota bacterium]
MNEQADQSISKKPSNGFAANLSWLVFSGAVSVANSVLVWIFMARWRSAEELASLTVVMGLCSLFYNICSFNLAPLFVREISRRSAKAGENPAAFTGTAAVFLLISGTLCAVLMTAGGFLLSSSKDVLTANAVLSFALIPTALVTLGEAGAVAFGRGRLIAGATTFENVLRTIVPLFLIAYGFPLWAICLSFVAVRVITAAIYFYAGKIRRVVFIRDEFALLCKSAPTFAGTIIFASLTWQIPLILLARTASESELANYGIAGRFFIPATIFAAGFANAMQPTLVREWEKSAAAGAAYLRWRAGLVLFATVAAAIIAPFLSRTLLTLLFGAAYADAAQTLDLLAISVIPFALVVVTARGLVAANAARIDLLANALGAVVCLAAGLWLVPRFGAVGAATAQIAAFALMAAVEIGFLVNYSIASDERSVLA